jgi:Rrf2 family protein
MSALISPTSEYALRAVVWLVSEDGRARTAQQIAAGTGLPAQYLAKVLQQLGRAGLLSSQRGVGGGYRLARAATELSALDVVRAVDPSRRLARCQLGRTADADPICRLHARIDQAADHVEQILADARLSELVRS